MLASRTPLALYAACRIFVLRLHCRPPAVDDNSACGRPVALGSYP